MTKTYETKLQVAITSEGHHKFWKGIAYEDAQGTWTRSESWQVKNSKEAKHLLSVPRKITARSQTTDWDQAIFDVESDLAGKKKKGYWNADEPAPARRPLPMTAHNYRDRAHDITWPAAAQPKLDGVRMLFNGRVGWSREDNDFAPPILQHLLVDTGNVILDGELMLPAPYTFQDTISAVKAYDPDVSPMLEYYVYDIADPSGTEPFRDRSLKATKLVESFGHPRIKVVPTALVHDDAELRSWHETYVKEGFEGAIVRNVDSPYKAGHDSKDLQKLKMTTDTEFEIVGVQEGMGSDAGTAKFTCRTPKGKTFAVRPEGSLAQRRKMWVQRDQLIGKRLTVQHYGYTDDGTPRNPVGLAVRDYE